MISNKTHEFKLDEKNLRLIKIILALNKENHLLINLAIKVFK